MMLVNWASLTTISLKLFTGPLDLKSHFQSADSTIQNVYKI